MKRSPRRAWCAALSVLVLVPALSLRAAPEKSEAKAVPPSRTFLFTYAATVTGLKPGETARVWLPVPPANEHQEVSIVRRDLPAEGRTAQEPRFGNEILYLQAKADDQGKVPLSLTYRVRRKEVKAAARRQAGDEDDLALFLKPDAKVPVGGKPLKLLASRELPRDQMELGKVLYDVVDSHMRYSKQGTGWGRGDAEWACDSGYGNCTDFHSLFISLARSKNIPAKFVIGFPIPEKSGRGDVPGYHCWAYFKPEGRGWVPVDISEANKDPKMKEYYFGHLTPDRVAFTVGRDLTLVPKQDGPPLNFFVYPYVEVDGRPVPADKVRPHCRYQDVGADGK